MLLGPLGACRMLGHGNLRARWLLPSSTTFWTYHGLTGFTDEADGTPTARVPESVLAVGYISKGLSRIVFREVLDHQILPQFALEAALSVITTE